MRYHTLVARSCAFIAVIALLGCASSPETQAPPGMRRVFLSSSEAAGGIYESEMLYGGTPTDRFDAKQARGYLYLIFNDSADHTTQFRIVRAATGVVAIESRRHELKGKPGPATWRGHYIWFQIAGRLSPGIYALDLTIDDQPAGTLAFTVSQ